MRGSLGLFISQVKYVKMQRPYSENLKWNDIYFSEYFVTEAMLK